MVQIVQLSSLTLEKSNLTSTLAIRIGVDEVFGKNYLENRRNSGSYHFDKNVTRHKVYIKKKKDIEICMNCLWRRLSNNKRTI